MTKEIPQPEWENMIDDPKVLNNIKSWWFTTPGVMFFRSPYGETVVLPLTPKNAAAYPQNKEGVIWFIGPFGSNSHFNNAKAQEQGGYSSVSRGSRKKDAQKRRHTAVKQVGMAEMCSATVDSLIVGEKHAKPKFIPDLNVLIRACEDPHSLSKRIMIKAINSNWPICTPIRDLTIFKDILANKHPNETLGFSDEIANYLVQGTMEAVSGLVPSKLYKLPDKEDLNYVFLASITGAPLVTADKELLGYCESNSILVYRPTDFYDLIFEDKL